MATPTLSFVESHNVVLGVDAEVSESPERLLLFTLFSIEEDMAQLAAEELLQQAEDEDFVMERTSPDEELPLGLWRGEHESGLELTISVLSSLVEVNVVLPK